MDCEDMKNLRSVGEISEFPWIQDEGKSNEGRERGGGGGGGGGVRKKSKWENFHTSNWSHYRRRRGVMNFWSFVDTFGISSVQMKQHKDIIISTNFRRENTKLSARLARSHSFHFFSPSFRLVVPSLGITKQINQHKEYCTDKICYFTNKILLTDWEESHVSDAKVPKFRLARSQSFLWVFSRVSGFLVGINHHEKDHITSVTT